MLVETNWEAHTEARMWFNRCHLAAVYDSPKIEQLKNTNISTQTAVGPGEPPTAFPHTASRCPYRAEGAALGDHCGHLRQV